MTPLLADLGEKALIRNFIKPYFNKTDDPAGVGDDCAMVGFGNEIALISTDRVPADLTAFKLGLLDYWGIGDYLARLNLSDTAACGGRAVGLLLNLGLPNDISVEEVESLCRGFGECADRHGAGVLGGDVTNAGELSISATSIGRAARGLVLTRRRAMPGDSVFVSRPLGLTPAAFHVFRERRESELSPESVAQLKRQFTGMEPMLTLGQSLAASRTCSSCIDNTDGIGQSLSELAEASGCSVVVDHAELRIPAIVEQVARLVGRPALDIVFDPGADFSLVGTLQGEWSSERASTHYGRDVEIIGRVEVGHGVWLDDGVRKPLSYRGWNYFSSGTA
jgi:thiamine-monophosphate kinase